MFAQLAVLLAVGLDTAKLVQYIAQIAAIVLTFAGMWGIFVKAGKPGWAAIIPIYNFVVLLQVIGRPWWWVLLLLIPCVGLVVWIFVSLELATVFEKGAGFTVGLILIGPIFLPLLGFGDAKYHRPVTA